MAYRPWESLPFFSAPGTAPGPQVVRTDASLLKPFGLRELREAVLGRRARKMDAAGGIARGATPDRRRWEYKVSLNSGSAPVDAL